VEIKRKKTRSKFRDSEAIEATPEYAQGIGPIRDSSSEDDEENASSNGSGQHEVIAITESCSGHHSDDMEDAIEEMEAIPIPIPKEKATGMNLAHLLPFLVNVASTASSADMDQVFFYEDNETSSYTADLPFYTPNEISIVNDAEYPESEERIRDEMQTCWANILQQMQIDESLRCEFRSVKELWQEIMRCLGSLEWNKVQSYLESMDNNYLYNSPPLVFWSSGGRIHHANQSFCNMTGYNVAELRVQLHNEERIAHYGVHSLFHPEETVNLLKRQLEATQSPHKSSYHMKTRLLTKYRQEIPVSAFVTNLRDSTGGSLLSVAHFAAL
jgi:PAS domain-containing protein